MSSISLYVSGFAENVRSRDLALFFESETGGTLRRVDIPLTKKKHPYGFFQFYRDSDAEKAVQLLNNRYFKGRKLRVQFSNGKQRDSEKSACVNIPQESEFLQNDVPERVEVCERGRSPETSGTRSSSRSSSADSRSSYYSSSSSGSSCSSSSSTSSRASLEDGEIMELEFSDDGFDSDFCRD